MKIFHMFIILMMLYSATASHAKDSFCDEFMNIEYKNIDGENISTLEGIGSYVLYDAPANSILMIENTKLSMENSNNIFPFSEFRKEGVPTIFFSRVAMKFACQLISSVAISVDVGEELDIYSEPLEAAKNCSQNSKNIYLCFIDFGNDVEYRTDPFYNEMSSFSKSILSSYVYTGIQQLVFHEFYHIIDNHPYKLKEKMAKKIDLEFSADFNAMYWALQNNKPYQAISYYFNIVKMLEEKLELVNYVHYEDMNCRYQNYIPVGFLGVFSIYATRIVEGDLDISEALEIIHKTKNFDKDSQRIAENKLSGCGRVQNNIIIKTKIELDALRNFIEKNLSYLTTEKADRGSSFPTLYTNNSQAVNNMIVDFLETTKNFEYINGYAAVLISVILKRATQTELISIQQEVADLILEYIKNNGSSKVYGRTLIALQIGKTSVNYNDPQIAEESKNIYKLALRYNPFHSEGWMNLFLADVADTIDDIKCPDTAVYISRSYYTHATKPDYLKVIFDKVREKCALSTR